MKGASGQVVQDANLVLGLPETLGLSDRRADAVSVATGRCPTGFDGRAALRRSGHQAVGRARPRAMVATADRAPVVAPPACSPPTWSRRRRCRSRSRHLADGRAAAVVLNSGNANAATGEPGRADALRMCELTAEAVGCATDRRAGVPDRASSASRCRWRRSRRASRSSARSSAPTPSGGDAAADAMLTTDTVRKQTLVEVDLPGGRHGARSAGMAKGAAMLAPAMATMLAVLTTDAAVDAGRPAARSCRARSSDSFNALVVDACTSTNDTVLVLANGAGRQRADHARRRARRTTSLGEALAAACADLARQMAADAEGATKLRHAHGARRPYRAPTRSSRRAAVASSQLVQCSLYGKDPYWGRVLSELGASGAWFDPEQVDIAYQGITVCRERHRVRARRRRARRARCSERDDRDRVRPPRRQRRGDHAVHRPHPRVRRREHGHVS